MSIFDRKPALRWLAPLAFVLVVGGTSGVVALSATAEPKLEARSAAELLVDLQKAQVDAMSGTVVQEANLGIPDLPGVGSDDGSLTSLISGTHTLRVWYSGPDKARFAVQPELNETDVILNGSDLWTWSSKDKTATHRALSSVENHAGKMPTAKPTDLPKTPQEAAAKVLAAIDPTTTVQTDSNVTVAGRAAYELVLRPKDEGSLVTEVRVAIDGTEHIPLRIRVFAGDTKAFEVSYSQVSFARPDDAQFAFKPPAGTKVTEEKTDKGWNPDNNLPKGRPSKPSTADQPKVVGQGWATVVVAKTGSTSGTTGELGQVLKSLPKVSGTWGSGHVLAGTAFSAVVTDDGRIAVGSVKPELLYAALEK